MPSTYGATHETTQPVVLSDEVLLAIGRLIRAFADIEELLGLFISAHTKLNQSQAVIVLGGTQLTRRLAMAEQIATIAGGEHLDRFNACFKNDWFRDAHTCRNVVAHGILLGETPDGEIAFLTNKTDQPSGNSTVQIVGSYLPKAIIANAETSASNLEPMAQTLGLQSWLKRHQPQALGPHRKGRLQSGQGGKQAPPPPSSQE
jgi:hypothetical protein